MSVQSWITCTSIIDNSIISPNRFSLMFLPIKIAAYRVCLVMCRQINLQQLNIILVNGNFAKGFWYYSVHLFSFSIIFLSQFVRVYCIVLFWLHEEFTMNWIIWFVYILKLFFIIAFIVLFLVHKVFTFIINVITLLQTISTICKITNFSNCKTWSNTNDPNLTSALRIIPVPPKSQDIILFYVISLSSLKRKSPFRLDKAATSSQTPLIQSTSTTKIVQQKPI